jgi:hypothetical protein
MGCCTIDLATNHESLYYTISNQQKVTLFKLLQIIIYSYLLLGVCFVAEDPKEREHLRKVFSGASAEAII